MSNQATRSLNAFQLRKGMIVQFYGGRFEIATDLVISNGHLPRDAYWPKDPVGPSDCVYCQSTCLEGEVSGYFKPGSAWTFQGNHRATFAVEVDSIPAE